VRLRPHDSFQFEARWINERAFKDRDATSTTSKILDVLQIMHREDVEVPFIATYRREYFEPVLTVDDLWTIFDYDEKFAQLLKEKASLQKMLDNAQENDKLSELIESAQSAEILDDLHSYLRHVVGPTFDPSTVCEIITNTSS